MPKRLLLGALAGIKELLGTRVYRPDMTTEFEAWECHSHAFVGCPSRIGPLLHECKIEVHLKCLNAFCSP